MRDWSDRQLLRLYLDERSAEALDVLIMRHSGWVRAAAVRQVGRSDLADDLTQAVFLVLLQKAPSLRGREDLAGWLFKVLRYAAMTALRSERRRGKREQIAGSTMRATGETPAAFEEMAPVLDELVAKLGQTDRRATLLRFYQQRTFGEVGAALGISEEAARKRVDRAMGKLRKLFARRGITADQVFLAGAMMANAGAPPAGAPLVLRASAQAESIASGAQAMMIRFAVVKTGLLAAGMIAASAIVVAGAVIATRPAPPTSPAQPTPSAAATAASRPASRPGIPGVTLASGIRLEILGVMPSHDTDQASWIASDGSVTTMPFRHPIVSFTGPQPGSFAAFEVANLPAAALASAAGPVTVWSEIEPRSSFSGYPWDESVGGKRRMFYILHIFNGGWPDVIRNFIAAGEWKELGEVTAADVRRVFDIASDDPLVRSTFSLASIEEEEGKTVVRFHDSAPAQRYVLFAIATDRDGKPARLSAHMGSPSMLTTEREARFTFDVPLAKFKSMRLRWRPLEVVEISGLNAEGAGQVKFMGWSPTTKPSGS